MLDNWLAWLDACGRADGAGWDFPVNFSEYGFTYGAYEPGAAASLALGCLYAYLRCGDARAGARARRILDGLRLNRQAGQFGGGYKSDYHYAWLNDLAAQAFGLAVNGRAGQAHQFPGLPEDREHFEALINWMFTHAGDGKPNLLNQDLIPFAYLEDADVWDYAPNYMQRHARALAEAAALIGGPQVRNTATLGGNVSHALPAGDGTIALLALAAEAEVASLSGRIRLPVEELFLGPGKSVLNPRGDLLVGFYLPLNGSVNGSAFRRVMRPQGVAIAIMNMGIWLDRDVNSIKDIRISIGPAGPRPFRARAAEDTLRGKTWDEVKKPAAVEAILAEAKFRTSPHRATAEYRRLLVSPMLEETFLAAWENSMVLPEDPENETSRELHAS